ncbi:MAG: GNAT family N-acetyltransferase [Nocardioides sp.]
MRIPALHESLSDVQAWLAQDTVLVVRAAERLVGAVRGSREGDVWRVGRLMVAPDLRGRGLGRWLLGRIEESAPDGVTSYALVTGAGSTRNQRLYKKAGYRSRGGAEPGVVAMSKPRRPIS